MTKDEDGRPSYDKMKGSFVWTKNVRPELLYYDGKWNRMMINTNEQYTSVPVDLGSPSTDYNTPGAMIYPFKKMISIEVADPLFDKERTKSLLASLGGSDVEELEE